MIISPGFLRAPYEINEIPVDSLSPQIPNKIYLSGVYAARDISNHRRFNIYAILTLGGENTVTNF